MASQAVFLDQFPSGQYVAKNNCTLQVCDGKEWERPGKPSKISLVAATFEKAITFNVNRLWEKPPLATAHQLMKTGGLWNTFVTIGYGSAFLKLLTDTVPSAVSEISKALSQGDPDAAYRDMEAIDFSKHVLSQNQRQLLVIQDEVSGWADLGNPVRVIEVLNTQSNRTLVAAQDARRSASA